MIKKYAVTFKAKMDDDDVGAMREMFVDLMAKEMNIKVDKIFHIEVIKDNKDTAEETANLW